MYCHVCAPNGLLHACNYITVSIVSFSNENVTKANMDVNGPGLNKKN